MKIENEVRAVKIMDDFSEETQISFNKDAQGELESTAVKLKVSPRIKIVDDYGFGVEGILASDIRLHLITETQAKALVK